MTQPDGIDMRRSGWTNPDGFTPQPRPATPAPPVEEVCGHQGPDGWTCDYRPGHESVSHWADDGSNGGIFWAPSDEPRKYQETTTFGDLAEDRRTYLPGRRLTALDEARAIAAKALEDSNPARWAIALERIRGLDND